MALILVEATLTSRRDEPVGLTCCWDAPAYDFCSWRSNPSPKH